MNKGYLSFILMTIKHFSKEYSHYYNALKAYSHNKFTKGKTLHKVKIIDSN